MCDVCQIGYTDITKRVMFVKEAIQTSQTFDVCQRGYTDITKHVQSKNDVKFKELFNIKARFLINLKN